MVQNCALMNQMRELIYVFVCYNIAGVFSSANLTPQCVSLTFNIKLVQINQAIKKTVTTYINLQIVSSPSVRKQFANEEFDNGN